MCAAKAIFYCPSMNSHRPRSQNTSKERTLNPEKDSTRKRPRSHVSLEKSSKNYSLWQVEQAEVSGTLWIFLFCDFHLPGCPPMLLLALNPFGSDK
jgi:hypothetical protein